MNKHQARMWCDQQGSTEFLSIISVTSHLPDNVDPSTIFTFSPIMFLRCMTQRHPRMTIVQAIRKQICNLVRAASWRWTPTLHRNQELRALSWRFFKEMVPRCLRKTFLGLKTVKRHICLFKTMLAGQIWRPRGGPAGPAKRVLGFKKDGNQAGARRRWQSLLKI